MLKDILKLNGIKELDKNQQQNLSGGIWGGGFDCPTFCESSDDCLNFSGNCAFTQAICATGTCLFFG